MKKNMIIEAHEGTIEPIRLATNILEESEFKCNICNAIWTTPANSVLGSRSKFHWVSRVLKAAL